MEKQRGSADDAGHRRQGRGLQSVGIVGVPQGARSQRRDPRRVFAAADELGYRVNRTAALMTARRSHLIGVMANIRNSFHAEMVEDIVEAADRAGYEVVLGAVTPTHGESKVIDTLLDFRCEGVVLLGPESTAGELNALGERLPTVVVGRRVSAASAGRGAGGRRARHRGRSSIIWSVWGTAGRSRVGRVRARSRQTGVTDICAPCDGTASATHVVIDGEFTENAGMTAAGGILLRHAADGGGVCQRPHRHRDARRIAPGRGRRARAGVGHRVRRQPAGPTGAHRPHFGEPGPASRPTARWTAVVERLDGGRTEPGVLGDGAAVGGPRDDGCRTGHGSAPRERERTATPDRCGVSIGTVTSGTKVDAGPHAAARGPHRQAVLPRRSLRHRRRRIVTPDCSTGSGTVPDAVTGRRCCPSPAVGRQVHRRDEAVLGAVDGPSAVT